MCRRKILITTSPFVLAIVASIIVYAYEYGSDPGYSGAPGDNVTGCTASGCHVGAPNTNGGSIRIAASGGNTYVPGQTQQIQVTITDSSERKYGFELSARVDNNPRFAGAGTFTRVDANTQVLDCSTPGVVPFTGSCPPGNSLQWIENNITGYSRSAPPSTTYNFNWTSPATNVGTITLYASGIAGSGALIVSLTHTYMASLQLSPSSTTLPTISLSPSRMSFGYALQSITSAQTLALSFNPSAAISWTASPNQPNITVSPTSGTGSAQLQITAAPGASGIITVTAPGASNSPQEIQVNVTSVAVGPPYGSFDTPVNNTTGIAGAIPVTGWALDNIGVASVRIWREPVVGEAPQSNGLVLIGDAGFVSGARPDVEASFPNAPLNYRAGWGYMLLTNFLVNANGAGPLGNGTYKLHALVTNQAGQVLDLGAHTITVDNAHASKPFGTIDTPAQGGTAAGNAYVNFGWALTQNPYIIPMDGSTITVILDGVPVGHPTYNQFRSDVANLFPGLANSNGAVGFFYIDTTTLANGVHTISWNVFDNAGRGDGIGSRYFTVQNTGTVAAPAVIDEPVAASTNDLVTTHVGFRKPDALPRASDGAYAVEMEELDRVELRVGASEGHLLVAGERRSLPIGSTLRGGLFYWQAGPGFLGEYELVFERPDAAPVSVRVVIHPKSYSSLRPQ
jgi:hypothetical protein